MTKNNNRFKNNIVILIRKMIIKIDAIRNRKPKRNKNKIFDDIKANKSSLNNVNSIQNNMDEVTNNTTEKVNGVAIISRSVTSKLLNNICDV
jgi:hypothetical protein